MGGADGGIPSRRRPVNVTGCRALLRRAANEGHGTEDRPHSSPEPVTAAGRLRARHPRRPCPLWAAAGPRTIRDHRSAPDSHSMGAFRVWQTTRQALPSPSDAPCQGVIQRSSSFKPLGAVPFSLPRDCPNGAPSPSSQQGFLSESSQEHETHDASRMLSPGGAAFCQQARRWQHQSPRRSIRLQRIPESPSSQPPDKWAPRQTTLPSARPRLDESAMDLIRLWSWGPGVARDSRASSRILIAQFTGRLASSAANRPVATTTRSCRL
jgi:hypothetical protein